MTRNTYAVHDAFTTLIVTTMVLAGAKLLDLLDWSWWGVFAPVLLIPGLIGMCAVYFIVVCASILIRLTVESLIERYWK